MPYAKRVKRKEAQKVYLDEPVGVSLSGTRLTGFDEIVTAYRTSVFNLKPTWGTSALRDDETTGTGSTIAETNGELKLSTGTNTAGSAKLRTKQRGQYQAGTIGEAGIGIRFTAAPTGDAYADWGYCDDNNGFGFGYDATGIYVFRRSGGSDTKVYQSSWNADKLDGTGPSGLTLDLTDGNIFQIEFAWYGYGEIKYIVNINNQTTNKQQHILVHSTTVDGSASIIDPNQPLSAFVTNGGTSTTNLDLYVGGRQFSYIDGGSTPRRRTTPVLLEAKSITTTTYEPVLAVRRKATFNGRTNSVAASWLTIEVTSDQKVYWYISYGDTLDGSWGAIGQTTAAETALEANTTATSGGSTQYHAISRGVVAAAAARSVVVERGDDIEMGGTDAITLWVKKSSTNATVDAVLTFEEQW